MSERLEWTVSAYGSHEGRAGGLRLFSVHYGTKRQDHMWNLSTSLPIKAPAIGQHYPTPTHAKIAAERLLAAFLAKVDPRTNKPEGDQQ